MKIFIATIPLILVFSCCTSSRIVIPEGGLSRRDTISCTRFQNSIENTTVDIIMLQGTVYSAQEVQLRKDSALFIDKTDSRRKSIATLDILKIERTDHWGGAIEGLMYGFLGGVLISGGTTAALVPRTSESGMGVAVVVALGALTGTTLGIIYGTLRGHVFVYEIKQAATDSSQSQSSDVPKP
jgi:hypothetical protein